MKTLRYILPTLLVTFGTAASLQAGPGVDYFRRIDSVSASAKAAREAAAKTPESKCKITETVLVTTGPRGTPVRQVINRTMDCSSCNDSSMACCAGKTKP